MTRSSWFRAPATFVVVLVPALCASQARATQDAPGAAQPQPGKLTLESINEQYLAELTELETRRLKRLEKLAESSSGEEQLNASIALFQGALASGHYGPVEAAAERVVKTGHAEPAVVYLASLVNILAEIDRGAYDESLQSLSDAVKAAKVERDGQTASMILPQDTRLLLAETYYQKLIQADQFEVAAKACRLIAENSPDEAIRAYAANRLARLERIGKPAPVFRGTDIDGKPFNSADLKANVVLVLFWASWCLPSGQEADHVEQLYEAYRGQGFRVVGINLDAEHEAGEDRARIEADVRRFLIDHHVQFPNLINGKGEQDYAKLFGVTDIPTNFLIDKDGTIVHVDLTFSNLENVLQKTLAR